MDEHWPQVMVFAQCNEKGYEERRGGTPVIEQLWLISCATCLDGLKEGNCALPGQRASCCFPKENGKVVEEQDGEAPHASSKDMPAKGPPEKRDGRKEDSIKDAN